MAEPSIKGTVFQGVVDDVNRLLAEGRLSPEEREVYLDAADLRALEEKILPARWYSIDSYRRLVELLVKKEGRGRREEYLRERGSRAAERLAEVGIYQQLEASMERLGPRVGHFMVSLASAIYNFSRWTFERGDDGYGFTITIEEAAALPDVALHATAGFIEAVATRTAGRPMRIRCDRESPDRVVYRARSEG